MTEKKFNVTRDNDGKVIGIEFNAEAFIIPNRSGKLEDFVFSSTRKDTKEVAVSVLDREPDEDERYIQMWYVVKDLNCENLVDHGASVELDGETYYIGMPTSFLPYSILKGKNDGDTIDVTFRNSWDIDLDHEDEETVKITMHVTLNQKDYRYRNFGSFQEVLKKVL